jgi:hypothetical protein
MLRVSFRIKMQLLQRAVCQVTQHIHRSPRRKTEAEAIPPPVLNRATCKKLSGDTQPELQLRYETAWLCA